MPPFPAPQQGVLPLEHAPSGSRRVISIPQEVQNPMDEQKPHLPARRVPHFFGLKSGLMNINGDIAL